VLNQFEGDFKKAPVGRYINFLAAYLKREKNATHEKARAAWQKLKSMNCEKNYESWKEMTKK
jgi:hypothetical protein